jgi:lambda repressor-like predicted transcriptional regulator
LGKRGLDFTRRSSMTKKDKGEDDNFEAYSEDYIEGIYSNWIREAMDKKGISITQLAEKTGLTYTGIWNILKGYSKKPQNRTIEKIKNVIEVDPPQIKTETELTDVGLGELTDFDPHDVNDHPTCNGVYVFYDVTDRPVYVGRSTSKNRSIKDRINEHYEKFWFKRPIVNHAAFIKIEDEKTCIMIERALIRFLKSNAVLNRQLVDRKNK